MRQQGQEWNQEARRILGRGLVLGVLIGALFIAGCAPVQPPATASDISDLDNTDNAGAGQASDELTPVQLSVGYVPSVQFATFYVAIEQGYYAEEGLDVSLEYGFEDDYLKLVGLGERDFMVGSGDQVILGRGQDLPVRYVMNWYTRYPVVVFAKESAGITEPADLAGKRVGLPGPFGATYIALLGMLDAAGLSDRDIQMESIGFTQPAAVSQGTIDAAVDYAANGPVVLQQEGIAVSTIPLDPYLPMPSNGLVTNEAVLRDKPELVAGMVRASLRGVAYTLEHPDEAFAIALAYVPEAGGENEEINRAIFDATLPYWQPLEGVTPGTSRAEDWAAAAEFMARIGLVEREIPAEELFTNEFVPQEP